MLPVSLLSLLLVIAALISPYPVVLTWQSLCLPG